MKNSQRPFVKIIKEICSENGIDLESFSYDWIFHLSKNGKTAHIFGYQFGNNSATSQLICADKCATSDILLFNGVPAVKHDFFMSPTNINYVGVSGNWERILKLLQIFGKVVCKANEGSGGGSVYLVSTQFELERAAHKIFSHSRTMAVSPFYDIEKEFRAVVLDNKVLLLYSKNIPFVEGDGASTLRDLLISYAQTHIDFSLNFDESDNDLDILELGKKYYLNWKHNLGQGAYPEIIQDESLIVELSDFALKAAKAVGIKFASVDIIKVKGNLMVLEINSGVMMDYFSQISDSNYQTAKSIYREAIEKMLF
jgi:glutathione synthase/RimK-type ligase-like ATP-grasp enzyme